MYPIEYELNPEKIDLGIHWLTLDLKNVGNETLKKVDIRLHSLDTLHLTVIGTGKFLEDLKPNETEVVPFQVIAYGTANIYTTIKAQKNGHPFHWESPEMTIKVKEEKAERVNLFVLTYPYTQLGHTLEAEVTILGLQHSEGLILEFWAKTPKGAFEELAKIEIIELSSGDRVRYSAEITPKETGYYTIHAYLYDYGKRIGHKTDSIFIQKD